MNYSGPSLYAMAKREREQLADYEEARESFEYLLEHAVHDESKRDELAEWFGDGGVTDYGPIFAVLVRARVLGVPGSYELLERWADSYAKDRT
jgi:hypothetical protein